MALPAKVNWVTFDVYGTLIDWEAGINVAFQAESQRDGFTLEDPAAIFPRFLELQHEIQSGSYELYAEVLRRARSRSPRSSSGRSSPRARASCRPRCRAGARSRRPTRSSRASARSSRPAWSRTSTTSCSGETRRHIPHDFDLVVTAQQVRSYKPDSAHFTEFARRVGSKKNWVHICCGVHADVEPCIKAKVPVIWVNRRKEQLDPSAKKPTAEVKTLLEAAKLLGAV